MPCSPVRSPVYWRRKRAMASCFRIGRVEYFHVVAVRAFADDDDVRTFCDAGIDESHLLHVLIQVVREFLEELEFASLTVHRTDDSDREDVDDLTVEAVRRKRTKRTPSPVEYILERAAERDFMPRAAPSNGQGEGNGKDKRKAKTAPMILTRRSYRGRIWISFIWVERTAIMANMSISPPKGCSSRYR